MFFLLLEITHIVKKPSSNLIHIHVDNIKILINNFRTPIYLLTQKV